MYKILMAALLTALPVIGSASTNFQVDTFEVISLEYSNPTTIVGVTAYGPTDKEAMCVQAAAASIAQGDAQGNSRYAATCLHIKFNGPVAAGQTVTLPFGGKALSYISIAVGYDLNGSLMGIEPLRAFQDGNSCKAWADNTRQQIYKDEKFPKGTSLIMYCMGVPALPAGLFGPQV